MSCIEVTVNRPEDKDSFDKAVKKLKKLVEKEGIVKSCQDRRYYNKPSDVKRRKRREQERGK
jgi:small subunit ribosomal protein S21